MSQGEAILGLDAKLYYNNGSYGTPDWQELKTTQDVTLNMEKGDTDVTTRGSQGWRERKGTLKDASVSTSLMWDPVDPGFNVFLQAFLNNSTVEVAVMDGDIATTGSQGLRMTSDVRTFTRNEGLEEALTVDMELIAARAANPPEWLTAP